MEDPAALFRALGDETRLAMLALIRRHGELCVCDLENVLGIGQSKASRHLRYLLNSGLLKDRREAVWIYYRIADGLGPAEVTVLDAIPGLLGRKKLTDLERKLATWVRQKNCATYRGKPVVLTQPSEEQS